MIPDSDWIKATSADGTQICARRCGSGPAILLVHGGLMSSHNFAVLAQQLATAWTVLVPDRRGRGCSGRPIDGAGTEREVEDLEALMAETGAVRLFGLSSGAIVVLRAALKLKQIERVALYEPPLRMGPETDDLTRWPTRFDREVQAGKLGAAMTTIMKGTRDTSFLAKLPRMILEPLLDRAITENKQRATGEESVLAELIPAMRYDNQIVAESEKWIDRIPSLTAQVLLLSGTRSQTYLRTNIRHLEELLPAARVVELPGLDHMGPDNGGQPKRVAEELQRFF